MKTAVMKDMTEVTLGGYTLSLNEEKMDLLDSLCNGQDIERRQLQELNDFLIECLGGEHVPSDEECVKYIKYLRNLRGTFDYLRKLGIRREDESM